MKKIIFLLLILSYNLVFAQKDFYAKSLNINKKGMFVLGSWGIGNALIGGVSLINHQGSVENMAFHQMNVGWGVINTAISGLGYIKTRNSEIPENGIKTWEAQQKIQQTFAVNAALDAAYIGFGMYLTEKGKNDTEKGFRSQGFGKSIIMQGAFLGIFDIAMYAIQKKHYHKDKSKLLLSFNGNEIGLKYALD